MRIQADSVARAQLGRARLASEHRRSCLPFYIDQTATTPLLVLVPYRLYCVRAPLEQVVCADKCAERLMQPNY